MRPIFNPLLRVKTNSPSGYIEQPTTNNTMDTKIHNRIWADPDFIELTDSEKLCYFWAITNTNTCGYVAVSERKLARDIDADYKDLIAAMKKVYKDDAVIIDDGIWFRRYIREQLGSDVEKFVSNSIFKTVKKQAFEICPEEVRDLIYEVYPEVRDREPVKRKKGASTGGARGDSTGEGEGEREGAGESKGEGECIRRMEKETAKATETAQEMELEVAQANQQSPSASCYLNDDVPFG